MSITRPSMMGMSTLSQTPTAVKNYVHRIRCGSTVALEGYSADTLYTGGAAYAGYNQTPDKSHVSAPVPSDALCRNVRYGDFDYNLPVDAAKQHILRLLAYSSNTTKRAKITVNGVIEIANWLQDEWGANSVSERFITVAAGVELINIDVVTLGDPAVLTLIDAYYLT